MSADEVLARLTDHANASLADLFDIADNGDLKLNVERARESGKLHLLKSVTITKFGPKFDLHDAQSALALLGKYRKLFEPKDGTITVKMFREKMSEAGMGLVDAINEVGLDSDTANALCDAVERRWAAITASIATR